MRLKIPRFENLRENRRDCWMVFFDSEFKSRKNSLWGTSLPVSSNTGFLPSNSNDEK